MSLRLIQHSRSDIPNQGGCGTCSLCSLGGQNCVLQPRPLPATRCEKARPRHFRDSFGFLVPHGSGRGSDIQVRIRNVLDLDKLRLLLSYMQVCSEFGASFRGGQGVAAHYGRSPISDRPGDLFPRMLGRPKTNTH